MNIHDMNLTKVLLAKEERLKEKYGDNYLTPTERMFRDMAEPIMPEENDLLGNVTFEQVGV